MKRSVLVAAVVLAAACSQSHSASLPKGPVVRLKLLAFSPNPLTVKAGTTVSWQNGEPITHTVTSGSVTGIDPVTGLRSGQHADGMFDHQLSGTGAVFSFRFDRPGTYSYFCSIHQGMNATVVVTA